MKLTGRTIFITGGGTGIGLALAKALHKKGNTVIVCGRRKEKLEEAKAACKGLLTVPLDISKDDETKLVLEKLETAYGGPDILINNAAVNGRFFFTDECSGAEEIERQIHINLTSTLKLTKLFLPLLMKKKEAAIVNISSALAYLPRHTVPLYSATKAALHSATISLRVQLRKTSVRVFEVFPPTVDTDMTRDARFFKMPVEMAAKKIIQGLEKNRREIRIGFSHVFYYLTRLAPELTANLLSRF